MPVRGETAANRSKAQGAKDMGNPFKRQGTSNTGRGLAAAHGRAAGHGPAAARGLAATHGPAVAHGPAAHGRADARGRAAAHAPAAAHGSAAARGRAAAHGSAATHGHVARGSSWKAALNKTLSVTLSFVLVVTMSPISSIEALAVEKYDEVNQAGGGL